MGTTNEQTYNMLIESLIRFSTEDLWTTDGEGTINVQYAPQEFFQYYSYTTVVAHVDKILSMIISDTSQFNTFVKTLGESSIVTVTSDNYVNWQRLFIIHELFESFKKSEPNLNLFTIVANAILSTIRAISNHKLIAEHSIILQKLSSDTNITSGTFTNLSSVEDRNTLNSHISAFSIIGIINAAFVTGATCAGITYNTRQCTYLNLNKENIMISFILYYLAKTEAEICTDLFSEREGSYNLASFYNLAQAMNQAIIPIVPEPEGTSDSDDMDKLALISKRAAGTVNIIKKIISELDKTSGVDGDINEVATMKQNLNDSRSAITKNTSLLSIMKHKIENGKSRLDKIWWENIFIMIGIILYVLGMLFFMLIPVSTVDMETKAKISLMLGTLVVISIIIIEVINLMS